jgi:MoaD family protein
MEITVRYSIALRDMIGKREEKITLREGSTLENALTFLSNKYGRSFEKYAYSGKEGSLPFLFLINGSNAAHLDGSKTRLENGATLSIILPVAGG